MEKILKELNKDMVNILNQIKYSNSKSKRYKLLIHNNLEKTIKGIL